MEELELSIQKINLSIPQCIDEQALKIVHNILIETKIPDSDINMVMLYVTAACVKHYKQGYVKATTTNH